MWEIKRKLTTDNDYLYTIYIYIRYIHMTLKRNYNLKARQDPWWTLRQFGKLMRSNSYANTYTIYKERDIYRTPLTRIKSNPLASWFFAYPKYTITHTHTPTYTQPKRNEKKCKNCLYILCNYFVFFLTLVICKYIFSAFKLSPSNYTHAHTHLHTDTLTLGPTQA